MIDIFKPDWTNTYTAWKAEQELKDFKFEGPGWYLVGDDTLLVIPVDRNMPEIWNKTWTETERFNFHYYVGRNPASIFNAIVNAPTRVDTRE